MSTFVQLVPQASDTVTDVLVYADDESATAASLPPTGATSITSVTSEPNDAQTTHEAFLALMETQLERGQRDLQLRVDAIARVQALADPHEQLSEYLALRMDDRRRATASTATADVANELLEYARRLPPGDDAEVALLAAFFFAYDDAPAPLSRGLTALLPVVAAMMERASSGAATLEQPVLL